MALATLSVDLEARLAKFEEGLAKAEREAEKRSAKITKALERIGTMATSLAGVLAGAFTVGAFNQWITSTAADLDALNDAADATGAAFEKLSGLEDLGRRTGTSFDTVTGILIKFNQVLDQAGDKDSAAAQALRAIGLEAEELRRLDPADALQKTAQALSAYEDNGDKARLVQELFGKSVREAAPFLKDLAEAGQLNGSATREQAEAAERFSKNIAELRANFDDLARSLFDRVIPALNTMFSNVRENDGFWKAFWRGSDRRSLQADAVNASRDLNLAVAELTKLQSQGEGNLTVFQKIRLQELRAEVKKLTTESLAASEALKAFDNGGKPVAAAPARSDKSILLSNDGYGPAYVTPPDPTRTKPVKAGPSASDKLLQGGWLDDAELESMLAGNLAKQVDALDRAFGQIEALEARRLQELDRFGEQLATQTADINASLIVDDRARGEAQIAVDREVLQRRLDELQLYGEERERLQAQLDENIAARQRALEEQLKPAWQRMVEGWSDATRLMADSYETLMDGTVDRAVDAVTKMVRSGKASADDLADYIQDTIARIIAQKAVAKLFEVADVVFGGGLGGGFAKGAAFQGGSVIPFANGGVVGTPTYFPMSGRRTGLMGEAGPEAIMPLKRGPDGRLGVQASAQGPQIVNHWHIAGGVTSAELAAMVPAIEARMEARLMARQRRPGYGV